MANTIKLEVDFLGTGLFAGANDDVTSDVWGQVQCRRGMDTASSINARGIAGSLQAELKNFSGTYSSFNASSPIYGNILPVRQIRLSSVSPTAAVLFTGILSHIDPHVGSMPSATLYATGFFSILGDNTNQISPLPQVGVQTGAVMTAILDAAGFSASLRSIDTGSVPVGSWFVDQMVALTAAQEIEETETGGRIYEGTDGSFVFEDRYHRLTNVLSTTSQATFADTPGSTLPYVALEQIDPLQEIYNEITATVTPYTVQSLAALWSLASPDVPIFLSAGQAVTYIATYSGGYVNPWTTPVVGTDILQTGVSNSDIGVSVSKTALSMLITITNNHATLAASITAVQARGVAYVNGTPYQIKSSDSTSQTKYNRRVYPLPGPYYSNQNYAQSSCDFAIVQKKDPHPMLTMTICASASAALFAQAVNRKISDRITVTANGIMTKLGISQDFFIEAISHSYTPGDVFMTTFLLSPASVQVNYWILGDATYGVLGSTTKLGF